MCACLAAAISGSSASAPVNRTNCAGTPAIAPWPGVARCSAPPPWRNSTISSGEPEPGPATAISAWTASAGSWAISAVSPTDGIGSSGSWWMRTSAGAGTMPNRSSSGLSARSGSSTAGSPWTAPSMITTLRPRSSSGSSSSGGSCMIRKDVVTWSGASTAHCRPGREHALGLGPVPQHHPRVDLAERVEAELERGDDAEVAAATTQRPEQLGVVLRVRAHQLSLGGHELDRGDAVGLQAVAACEPAHAAAERVARDADVRAGAVERDQTVRRGGVDDLLPQHAGTDAGDPVDGVDLHAADPARLDQDRAVEAAQRTRVVAGGLGRDAQAVLAGGADDGRHLVLVRGVRDGRGALVDGEIERLAGSVVAVVAGQGDGTAAEVAQGRSGIDHRHAAHRRGCGLPAACRDVAEPKAGLSRFRFRAPSRARPATSRPACAARCPA